MGEGVGEGEYNALYICTTPIGWQDVCIRYEGSMGLVVPISTLY